MSGKGDTPRPVSVPKAELDANWVRTFTKPQHDLDAEREQHLKLAKQIAHDLRHILAKLTDDHA